MIKNSAIYILSSLISAIFPFIIIPILTHHMTVEEYGEVAMFMILIAGFGSLVGLSVHGAANRKYFDKINRRKLAIYNGNCLILLTLSGAFVFGLVSVFNGFLSSVLSVRSDWVLSAVFISYCNFCIQLRLGQWQVRKKALAYGFFQVSNALLVFITSIFFVVLMNFSSDGRFYSIVASAMFFAIISILSLTQQKLLKIKFNSNHFKDILQYGVPLIPHAIGAFFLLSIDRLMIGYYLSVSDVGIYAIAVSVGMMFNIFYTGINKAFTPWLFGKLNHNEDKQKIVKITYLLILSYSAVTLIGCVIIPLSLKFLIDEKYYESIEFIPYLIVGQQFIGMYFVVSNYIFYIKKTKYLSYVTISNGVVNAFLLFLFLPTLGLYGAGMSFVISSMLQFFMTWYLANKLYKMPWFKYGE